MATNIERNPDDPLYRRLRCRNPKIQRLLALDGAVRVFAALGLAVVERSADGSSNGAGMGASGSGSVANTEAQGQEPCLWMEEPNLERDMDAWATWFDNVQAVRKALDAAIEASS